MNAHIARSQGCPKLTFIEPFLLILGRKFSLSLLNVISKLLKNLFIPSSRDVGLRKKKQDERERAGYVV